MWRAHFHFVFSAAGSLGTLALALLPIRLAAQECQSRSVPVAFRDAHSRPIRTILVRDLEAKVRGKPVKIISLEPDRRPRRVVLLMDTSGSMHGMDKDSNLWSLELEFAQHFAATQKEKLQVALLTFGARVYDTVEFSPRSAAVEKRLSELAGDQQYLKTTVKGRTALYDAILHGIELVDHPTSADASTF